MFKKSAVILFCLLAAGLLSQSVFAQDELPMPEEAVITPVLLELPQLEVTATPEFETADILLDTTPTPVDETIDTISSPVLLDPIKYAVQASAEVLADAAEITINWVADPHAVSYTVQRRADGTQNWGEGIDISADSNTYTDTNIEIGKAYEYQITKQGNQEGSKYSGFGYVYAGINLPIVDDRGTVVLILDNTITETLAIELSRLERDLLGDGWYVIRHEVSPDATPEAVKNIIVAEYMAAPDEVNTVFLFGHIPIPYSGLIAPDGHIDHAGAWPADVYYGDMDGVWTDVSVNADISQLEPNHNFPGDGKFDQSRVESGVELMVGRVDLRDMPAFAPKTEVDLLRQYLNKDHAFRIGELTAPARALLDDQFGSYGEGFSDAGWRTLAPLVGAENTTAGEWFDVLPTEPHLWAFSSAPGKRRKSTGIGETADFAATDPQSIFNLIYGSWFGDWNMEDNYLRAPLASETYGLTSAWSGRPHWFMHHMALGNPIGYSARITQNNDGSYRRDGYRNYVHIALMGDPTLRMHTVKPPTELEIGFRAGDIELYWEASTDDIVGYHVYVSDVENDWTRMTEEPVVETSYTHEGVPSINSSFMVKAVKFQESPSGSYYNTSQGVFKPITLTPTAVALSNVRLALSYSWLLLIPVLLIGLLNYAIFKRRLTTK